MMWVLIIGGWTFTGLVIAVWSVYQTWSEGKDQTHSDIFQWSAFFILVGPLTLLLGVVYFITVVWDKLTANLTRSVLKGKASVKVERTLRNTDVESS